MIEIKKFNFTHVSTLLMLLWISWSSSVSRMSGALRVSKRKAGEVRVSLKRLASVKIPDGHLACHGSVEDDKHIVLPFGN